MPRMPPPPWTSNCPADSDGQTSTGTDTRHERTRPPMAGPGRTATDRPSSRAQDRAHRDADAHDWNEATATRPEGDRDDTRHDTKPHEPYRSADHTTDENEGTHTGTAADEDETTTTPPTQNDEAHGTARAGGQR
jgi:hypothetical protein